MIYTVSDMNYELLHTEILFRIAEAKAKSIQLIEFELLSDKPKFISDIIRVLKAAKKKNKIQLYASIDDFVLQTTEAKYLLNKYPNILNDMPENKMLIFVMVNII